MGTRAIYTFYDQGENSHKYHIFKHWDGYLEEVYKLLKNALAYAWELPRFEADEFACAFITANKTGPADIRLCISTDQYGDIQYRYEITCIEGKLFIIAYTSQLENPFDPKNSRVVFPWIFRGSLEEFEKLVKHLENKGEQ